MSTRRAFVSAFFVGAALGLLSACSPGSLFGDGKDRAVESVPTYRKVNVDCAGLRLAKAELDPPTARALVNCFNSDGALPELAKLVQAMSDRDLGAVLGAINRHVLANPRLLYGFEKSFYDLRSKQALDPLLKGTVKILGNGRLVSATLGLLRGQSVVDRLSGYLGLRYAVGDPNVLRAFEVLGPQVDAAGALGVLEQALLITRAREFPVLEAKLLAPSPRHRDLDALVQDLIQYLQMPRRLPVGKLFMESVLSGNLLKSFDDLAGNDQASVRAGVTRFSSAMGAFLDRDGQELRDLGRLFGAFASPTRCLKGAKTIDNIAAQFLGEVIARSPVDGARFVAEGSVLEHAVIAPFCDVKPELDAYYPAAISLAQSSSFEAVHAVLKSLGAVTAGSPGHPPLLDLVVDLLADESAPGASPPGGLQLLIPLLSEINDRGAWDDLALLATLSRRESRGILQPATLRLVTEPSSKLGGLSVTDVLAGSLARVGGGQLRDWLRSVQVSMQQPESQVAPALGAMRDAYFVNDAHPFVELARDLLSQASQDRDFYGAILTLSGSDEFKAFLGSLDRMSETGQLRDLLGAGVTIFHDFAAREAYAVQATAKPKLAPQLRHNLVSNELTTFVGHSLAAPVSPDCALVKLAFPLGNYADPGFNLQLDHFTNCLNSENARPDAAEAITYLRAAKVEDGRTALDFIFDFVKNLPLAAPDLGWLTDGWTASVDDGRFFRLLDAIPLATPALRPGFDLIAPIVNADRPELKRLASLGGQLLRRDDWAEVSRYVDDLAEATPPAETLYAPAPPSDAEKGRLQKWIANKECDPKPSAAGLDFRSRAILDDYAEAIDNWEWIDGKGRRRWSFSEFRPPVEQLLGKLAEPSKIPAEEHPDGAPKYVVDALLNAFKDFSLRPAQGGDPGEAPDRFRHFTPEVLASWFQRRANDYRPITYFYPGEDKPRVRYVSTLDMLELVLLNVDFTAPFLHKNFGLEFTALLGSAWGDEPASLWPPEIVDEFKASGQAPLKLSQAVSKMWDTQLFFEQTLGFPNLPGCTKRDPADGDDRELPSYGLTVPSWIPLPGELSIPDFQKNLYNTRQLLHVMQDNNPTASDPGLRVLRDIFFQIHYSSAPGNRDPGKGWANNLSLVLRLTRMGVLREASRHLRLFADQDPKLLDFFRGLVNLASSPEAHRLARALAVDDGHHDLAWKALEKVFDVLNAAEGVDLTPDRQASLQGKSPAEALAIQASWRNAAARMKSLGFYVMSALPGLSVTDSVVKSLTAVIGKDRAALVAHGDKLEAGLTSAGFEGFVAALYVNRDPFRKPLLTDFLREALADPQTSVDAMAVVQTFWNNPTLGQKLDLLSDQLDQLRASAPFQALRLGEIARQFADFLEERPDRYGVTDPQAVATAHLLRNYLADRLQAGDVDQVLRIAAQNPDEFYHLLKPLGIAIENGELKDFLGYLRRKL